MVSVLRLIISALMLCVVTVLFVLASGRVHADAFASATPEIDACETSEYQTTPPPTRSGADSQDTSEKEIPPTTASQVELDDEEQEPPTLFYGY
jgi:hypothetical protein